MSIGRGISDCDGAPTTAAERRQNTQWVMADQFEYAILDERGTWRNNSVKTGELRTAFPIKMAVN